MSETGSHYVRDEAPYDEMGFSVYGGVKLSGDLPFTSSNDSSIYDSSVIGSPYPMSQGHGMEAANFTSELPSLFDFGLPYQTAPMPVSALPAHDQPQPQVSACTPHD
jgi:hypothetical protein